MLRLLPICSPIPLRMVDGFFSIPGRPNSFLKLRNLSNGFAECVRDDGPVGKVYLIPLNRKVQPLHFAHVYDDGSVIWCG